MLPESAGRVRYFKSSLLSEIEGVAHAFPCKSGVAEESLEALRNRLRESFDVKAFLTVKQVHGTDVLVYDGPAEKAFEYRTIPYDAIVTSTPGLAVGVRTADCLPVLIAAEDKAVAAVHGGWKGVLNGINGIMGKAIEKLAEFSGIEPARMIASIGPHIRSQCYEVGPDVADPFREKFGDNVLKPGKGDRSYLNLEAVARLQLEKAGMAPENIDTSGGCTHCREDLFYSYRRDGKPAGRQLSFILRK